mgnify:CR=1 FL=1
MAEEFVLPKRRNADRPIYVRVPADMDKRLEELAEASGLTKSDVIRRIVDEALTRGVRIEDEQAAAAGA